MDREIPMYSFEVGGHPDTNLQLIELKNEEGKNILVVATDVFATKTYFRCMNKNAFSAPAHSVFINLITDMGGELQKVVIDDLKKGQFFATIYYTNIDGELFTARANAGDALAMAFCAQCCVSIKESVVDIAEHDSLNRVYWYTPLYEETLQTVKSFSRKKLATIPLFELKNLLKFASDTEDFEFARRLKTAIDAQKGKNKD
jgi:bifunctional DNase/RNase